MSPPPNKKKKEEKKTEKIPVQKKSPSKTALVNPKPVWKSKPVSKLATKAPPKALKAIVNKSVEQKKKAVREV